MDFTVVVPYAWTGPSRESAFEFVCEWWNDMGYPVVIGHGDAGNWSKGAAVDSARRLVESEGLIIADCDALVSREILAVSVAAIRSGAAWAMPHGRVVRMTRTETQRVYRVGETALRGVRLTSRHAPPGGGLVVLTTAAYDTVGGIDPRFVGWGGEDISFARALDTLVGLGIRFGGYLWHLWHPATARRPGNRASVESEELAGRYLDAEGDPVKMRAVIDRVVS